MAGDGPLESEFRIVRPDGEVRWIHHVCRPIHNKEGRFMGTRGFEPGYHDAETDGNSSPGERGAVQVVL